MADVNLHTPPAIEHNINAERLEERAVKNIVQLQLKREDFSVHKIQEGVFAIGKNDTWGFVDARGKIVLDVNHLRDPDWAKDDLKKEYNELFTKVLWQAGYREVNNPTKNQFDLYDIRKGKDVLVAQNSKEYYEAWRSIDFFNERLRLTVSLIDKTKPSEDERRNTIKGIQQASENGYVRIRDLILLSSPKLAYLKLDDFNKLLPFARNALLDQIGDPKWGRSMHPITKKMPDTITQAELDQYRQLNLVDANLYSQATKKLADVERARQTRDSKAKSEAEKAKGKIEGILK